jgi:predicted CoA-binding protein
MPTYSDDLIKSVLRSTKVIAMVGASGNEMRPSYFAMKYLLDKGFEVMPVNPGMVGKTILRRTVYGSLKDVPAPVDMVDIFRAADAAPGIVKEALGEKTRLGVKTIWMQLGVINEEAAEMAREAGLTVIMDRCPKIEYGRMSGEISWLGVNRRTIDNRKAPLFRKGGALRRF